MKLQRFPETSYATTLSEQSAFLLFYLGFSFFSLFTFLAYGQGYNDFLPLLLAWTTYSLLSLLIISQRKGVFGSPLCIFWASVTFGFLLKINYLMYLGQAHPERFLKLLAGNFSEVITSGALLLTAATVFFILGYLLPFPRLKAVSQKRWRIDKKPALIIVSVVLSIGVIGALWWIAQGSGQDFVLSGKRFMQEDTGGSLRIYEGGYIWYRLSLFLKIGFYFLLLYWFNSGCRERSAIFLILAAASALGFFFVSVFFSNRGALFVFIFDIMAIYHLAGKRIRFSTFAYMLGIACLIIVVSSLRANLSIDVVFNRILSGRYFMEITKTALIKEYSDLNLIPRGAESLYGWLTFMLPESWFQESKPLFLKIGRYIGENIYGYPKSGVPPGFVAQLYMGAQWLGVTAGMLLFGYMARIGWAVTLAQPKYDVVSFLVIMLLNRLILFGLNNDIGTAILKSILEIAPLVGLTMLAQLMTNSGRSVRLDMG